MGNAVKKFGGRFVQVSSITEALEEADPYKRIGVPLVHTTWEDATFLEFLVLERKKGKE